MAEAPAFRDEFIFGRGLEPMPSTPEQFAQYLKEDRVRLEKFVKQSGYQPQ